LLVVGVGAALAAGCSASSPASVVTVLVDYEHDEFATQFIKYLPDHVTVHPGDTIQFKQAWTGEPHTVTFGTIVQEPVTLARPIVAEFGDLPFEEVPEDAIGQYMEAQGMLPTFYGPPPGEDGAPPEEGEEPPEEGDGPPEDAGPPPLPQAIAQPCFIATGDVPEDGAPCDVRELPPFDGTAVFYNSGIIPYEGPGGNVFEFQLADDIAPGEYAFYCAVHGPFQNGIVEVVPADQEIPTPQQVAADLREQVTELVAPYESVFASALREEYRYRGEDQPWNYGGLLREDGGGWGIVNEFLPEVIEATVDEPVTWRLYGPHSLSFDVPEYFPIVEFLEDGSVRENEAIWEPAGGAPEVSEEELEENQPFVIDGGTYDGSGFWSSGVLWNEAYVEYTLRFATPGEYRYACLIHPPMVGTVNVTE
jgi:plastocyanin